MGLFYPRNRDKAKKIGEMKLCACIITGLMLRKFFFRLWEDIMLPGNAKKQTNPLKCPLKYDFQIGGQIFWEDETPDSKTPTSGHPYTVSLSLYDKNGPKRNQILLYETKGAWLRFKFQTATHLNSKSSSTYKFRAPAVFLDRTPK